ncbi:hypothetical protein V6N13_125061 [Hibiscus sabdariffa]
MYPEDFLGWGQQPDRQFSVKYVYMIQRGTDSIEADPIWKVIHRYFGLPRIKTFMWLACNGWLMTNVERTRRHFTTDERCLASPLPSSSLELMAPTKCFGFRVNDGGLGLGSCVQQMVGGYLALYGSSTSSRTICTSNSSV